MSKAVKLTLWVHGEPLHKKRLDLTCNLVWRELSLICAPVPGLLFYWCEEKKMH